MRITLILLLILCLLWAWCLPGNEVETVSMYMYNGVKLPALPEFEYEYAYIAENVAIKGWYALFVSDKAFVYDKLTNTMIRQDGSTVMRCVCTGEAWGEFVSHDADSLLAPIWSNYDVLDTNGDVRLYATEPAKMWENARSFLIGLAMAFAGKPLPIFQGKEPVAYLYGHVAREGETPTHTIDGVGYVGAMLPKLPVEDVTWDVETHPYVFIYRYNSNTLLACSSVRSFFSYGRKEAGEFCYNAPGRIYMLENDSFVFRHELGNILANGFTEDQCQLIWTNHDVLKDDGSVYMAAGYTDFPDAPPVPAEVVVADPCPDKSVMYLFDNAATDEVGDTVTLPAVPEVDLRIYPYLSLSIHSSDLTGTVLSATRHPLPYDNYYSGYPPYGMAWRLYDGYSEWKLVSTTRGGAANVWANYDVYDINGNLKIAASVPTPIYE